MTDAAEKKEQGVNLNYQETNHNFNFKFSKPLQYGLAYGGILVLLILTAWTFAAWYPIFKIMSR